jgi:hypothetical protein
LGVVLVLIGLFYAEEDWRGERAWKNCKRALEAQGVNLDWTNYIPAPVPEEQNVFGVPEMQKWFVGRQATELSKKLSYPGTGTNRGSRLIVAELTIGLPGASVPGSSNFTGLQWGDPKAGSEAARAMKAALGPVVMDPVGVNFLLRLPEEVRPAQIFLRCQTAPTTNELLDFVPKPIVNTILPRNESIQVEPGDNGAWEVTMLAPDTVAEYLKWSEQFEPDFALIRKALQRPYVRLDGNYSVPADIPIPNFVTVRAITQRLAAMAQCHLVEGKPEEALRDLTLMHDLCRILEGSRPMTLVAAMINVAVGGLYADTIADGLRWHSWREPQLATLEKQLEQINLLQPVEQDIETEPASACHTLETISSTRLLTEAISSNPGKAKSWKQRRESFLDGLIPRGWIYQNMVAIANGDHNAAASLDPASRIVSPDKAKAAVEAFPVGNSYFSPYHFFAAIALPNYIRAFQTTAHNQMLVNQALIACALERYHLAHGEYPESLDALAPQFLAAIPHDVIGGRPPHYRRAADGTYVLYSIGWSGRDVGGVPGKTVADGDWVWPNQ